MVNSHAPRTARAPPGLAEAAHAGPPPGLLAGSQDCIACLPPGLENCVRIKNGAPNGFRRFPQPSPWLWPDDRAHPVSASRSSLAAESYVWQNYDLFPEFPELHRFLTFWQEKLEGPLHSVRVAHCKLIKPAELKAIDREFRLH